MTSRHTD